MGLTGGVKSHRLSGQISPYCEKNVIGSVRIARLCFSFVKGITLFTSLSDSPHTHQVVDALTSQTPRYRYLVGLDARFFLVWLARFPTAVADFIITRVMF